MLFLLAACGTVAPKENGSMAEITLASETTPHPTRRPAPSPRVTTITPAPAIEWTGELLDTGNANGHFFAGADYVGIVSNITDSSFFMPTPFTHKTEDGERADLPPVTIYFDEDVPIKTASYVIDDVDAEYSIYTGTADDLRQSTCWVYVNAQEQEDGSQKATEIIVVDLVRMHNLYRS